MFEVKYFETVQQIRQWTKLHVDTDALVLLCCSNCKQFQQQNCLVVQSRGTFECISCHALNSEPILIPDPSRVRPVGAYLLRVFHN